jgi:hypothetical protein
MGDCPTASSRGCGHTRRPQARCGPAISATGSPRAPRRRRAPAYTSRGPRQCRKALPRHGSMSSARTAELTRRYVQRAWRALATLLLTLGSTITIMVGEEENSFTHAALTFIGAPPAEPARHALWFCSYCSACGEWSRVKPHTRAQAIVMTRPLLVLTRRSLGTQARAVGSFHPLKGRIGSVYAAIRRVCRGDGRGCVRPPSGSPLERTSTVRSNSLSAHARLLAGLRSH